MVQPPTTFETQRLRLRQPLVSDAHDIFKNYAQDPLTTRYVVWRPHANIQETKVFLDRCQRGWTAGDEFPWAITVKGEDEVIGMVGLRVEGFKAELGYILGRPWWGRGFVTEAASAVVSWTMAQPRIFRLYAMCDIDNPASARVLEKLGMQCEGVLRRTTIHPNVSDEPRDSYCYSIVK